MPVFAGMTSYALRRQPLRAFDSAAGSRHIAAIFSIQGELGMKRKIPMAAYILIAMVLGIVVGYMVFISYPDKKVATQIAGYISIMSDIFLRLIKMLIGPLVFSTLVVGIAHMGDAKSVGRIFAKALGWFVIASIVSLLLGLLLANLLHPGK